MTAPDPNWPLYSGDWQCPHTWALYWHSAMTCVDELRYEIEQRKQLYPQLIAKGKLDRNEANREVAIFKVIAEEIRTGEPIEDDRFTWHDRVHALRRELNLRRATYPKRIAKGKMAPEDADRHLELLDCIHYLYWCNGFGTDDPRMTAAHPERSYFEPGLRGNWQFAHAVVERSNGRRAFFLEHDPGFREWAAAAEAATIGPMRATA